MASSVTPLRRPIPPPHEVTDRIRQRVLALAPSDGHTIVQAPDLCIYRFSQPTTFVKAATFGVTLGVVLSGSKTVRLAGHELEVDPGSLLVVTRELAHESAITNATKAVPYLGLSLLFEPDRVARALLALREAGAPESRERVPAFSLPFDEKLTDAIDRLLSTLGDPLERRYLAPLVTDEILFRLLRSDAAAAVRSGVSQAPDSVRILDSMQFIREHHDRALSVGTIARRVAMSPSHFAHRFRAVARVSPMRYLREVRLERARALLLEDGARAGDVAARVGFESPAHFAREFKRRFGAPPSRFMRGGLP